MKNYLDGIIVLIFLLISSTDSIPILNETSSSSPLLLLISFDGFRWDYPDIYNLPHFNSILKRGVRVKHIDNNFATVTFPSHFTIVTGLYDETHGVIGNEIYDPILNDAATIDNMNDTKWWYVILIYSICYIYKLSSRSQNPYSQPIWVSNQLDNSSSPRRSGVIAWPGSDIPINGYIPFKHEDYKDNRSLDSILQRIFEWFREPIETRINLGVAYHLEPDHTGQIYFIQ
jgi:hypothetical protein